MLPVRIQDGRKIPLLKRWPAAASNDPDVIISPEWCELWRSANAIGAVTDGLICVDFDPVTRNTAGHTNRRCLQGSERSERTQIRRELEQNFEDEFGSLPATAFKQETGRGGLHVIMTAPEFDIWRGAVFKNYETGNVDIKAGNDNFFILSPSPGYEYLSGVQSFKPSVLPPLPELLAECLRNYSVLRSPLRGSLNAAPVCVMWKEVAKLSRRYKASLRTLQLLLADCEWLTAAPDGRQETTLWVMGCKWGRRVRARYVAAERAWRALSSAAANMPNYRPHEPWPRWLIEEKLRRAIAEGFGR